MKRIDLLTYLLIADPSAAVKKTLGKINMENEIIGIEQAGENMIDVWSKHRIENQLKSDEPVNMVYVKPINETYTVDTIDVRTGKLVATRQVEKSVKSTPNITQY